MSPRTVRAAAPLSRPVDRHRRLELTNSRSASTNH